MNRVYQLIITEPHFKKDIIAEYHYSSFIKAVRGIEDFANGCDFIAPECLYEEVNIDLGEKVILRQYELVERSTDVVHFVAELNKVWVA